jgi:hypothetical protein
VSKQFSGKDRADRSDMVYPILQGNLPEDTWQDIMMLLLLSPDEVDESSANFVFEHPTPSRL